MTLDKMIDLSQSEALMAQAKQKIEEGDHVGGGKLLLDAQKARNDAINAAITTMTKAVDEVIKKSDEEMDRSVKEFMASRKK